MEEVINKNNNLINPFIEERPDLCPFCKSQRIELFSFNGYPQHYSEAVNAHLMGYEVNFDKYEIRMMKCKSCNKEFAIDWSTRFPRPLKNSYKTTIFLSEFISGV